MNDIWVCDDCKSINRRRDAQCYRCRAPRSGAMETPGLDLRAANAAAERSVRSYVISWPLAAITVVLLIAVAVVGVIIVRLQAADFSALRTAFLNAIASGGGSLDEAMVTQSVQLGLFSLIRGALTLLALVCFAGWLGLVTRNVPLLGGGTPSRTPLRVFIYTLIPIWNLFKVPGILQDLLYRVEPEEGGAFMVLAAWIGLVGSYFVSVFGGWIITIAGIRALIPQIAAGDLAAVSKTFGDILDQSFWLGVIVALMVAFGTVLLAGIMIRLESRCAARDREIRAGMAITGAPTVPEGPAWGQPADGPIEHDPFASPAPPTATWRQRVEPTYYHSPSPPAVPGAQTPKPTPPPPPGSPQGGPPPPPPGSPRVG
ncbi:MAG: DUF4328 domain-containing protein [Chloroflexota bacterium]